MAERFTLNRRATSLLFDAKITARSGDDRGQVDTGRLHPHFALMNLNGVFQGCFDECAASLICALHLQAESHRELLDKIRPARAIFKYRFAFDPSNDDMMQGAGDVYASSARQI